MGQLILNNGESNGTIRGKINTNFSELYSIKVEASQVLTLTNVLTYTPTNDYHPATKAYVDQGITTWNSVYDPQAINADVFDRTNHTGTQLPITIVQDSNNRFVTDTEKGLWNSKEDAIGVKGTAFNKSFGTTTGTVSQGDHTHTKTDIGLGNVDNTADVNKGVSTPQQTALDLKLDISPDYLDFSPQATAPTYLNGRLYFDDNCHSLVINNGVSDQPLEIGQSTRMRVINKSGSTINSGQACRHNGVDGVTGLPKIELAIATNFVSARVLGVATGEILDNTEGWLTIIGPVLKLDTFALPTGVPVYLSDTIAGSYTINPPDIVSQVGGILVSDTVDGELMVSIVNNISLPTLLAIMQTAPDTYTLPGAATYEDVDNYSAGDSVGMTVNTTTGKVTIPNTGWYRMHLNLTATVDTASPGGDAILFRLYNFTQSLTLASTTLTLDSSNLTGSRSIAAPFSVSANDVVVLQVSSTDSSADLTFDDIALDISTVHVNEV